MKRRPAVPIVLLLTLLIGCGVSARTQALRVGLVSLNAARDTMLTVSKEREAQIVAEAASKDEGKAKLETWRAAVDKVAAAINLAYQAIYGAAILDDVKSASDAGAAVAKALAMLKDLKADLATLTPAKESKP